MIDALHAVLNVEIRLSKPHKPIAFTPTTASVTLIVDSKTQALLPNRVKYSTYMSMVSQ